MSNFLQIIKSKNFLLVIAFSLCIYLLDLANLAFTILTERIQLSSALPLS